MKNICFILFLFLFSQTIAAQGVINITQDPAIEAAINKHIAINKANTKQNGWCIQLMASNNRDKSDEYEISIYTISSRYFNRLGL